MDTILVLALVAALATVGLVIARNVLPAPARYFIDERLDFLWRLWIFWGPRLTDRNFIQAVLSNAALLGIVSWQPEVLNLWTLILWVGFNLINPTWDSHAAGEKVLKPRIEVDVSGAAESVGH